MSTTVNGVAIDESKVVGEMARMREGYEAYVRENGSEPSEAELREWAEENLIEAELFRQEAVARLPEPTDERAQQYVRDNAAAFEGVPEAGRLAQAKEALRARALMKEVRKGVTQPDEAEARRYYDENPEQFVMPETLRLSHICRVVGMGGSKSELFLDLLRLKSEIDGYQVPWVEAVEQFSDTFARDRGVFDPVARGELPPEIEEKLFALEPGAVSDVIEFGGHTLHLFKLLAREPAAPMPFKDFRDSIVSLLFGRKCQTALEAFYDTLKAKAVIRRGS